MPIISAVGLFCCDKFEETPNKSKLTKSYFSKLMIIAILSKCSKFRIVKIIYTDDVIFRVETIEAKAEGTFRNYEWVIGNHSDELTPWIPVMSHLSKASYFVLPCCAYDFFGKYQRVKQKVSQYRDYLDYIFDLGQKCGYDVKEDKLRIPSTKRTCFIGKYSDNCQLPEDLLHSLTKFVPIIFFDFNDDFIFH